MTSESDSNLLSTGTLAIWLACLSVGIAGLKLAYPRPRPAMREPPPVVAQKITVEITRELLPPPDMGNPAPPPADAEQPPPPPPDAPAVPAAPPMTAVAVPNPDIAAPIPVAGPTQIVAAAQAVPPAAQPAPQTQPVVSAPAASAAPAIQQITYGQGEGRQPAPEYPREAQLAHQQGVVVIRFTVDEEGSVVEADATTPCPFPLLNQAALRTVRETWRFPPGAPRAYEVAVRFQLRKS